MTYHIDSTSFNIYHFRFLFLISAAEDYDASVMPTQFATFSFGSTSPMDRSINIIEDLVFEPTESFNLSLSTSSPDCIIPNPLVPVTILDDGEDELQQLSLQITSVGNYSSCQCFSVY